MSDGCTGKIRHRDMQGAAIHAKKRRNKGFDVYRCHKCNGWHIGTSRKPWKVQARIDQLLGRTP